MSADRSEFTRRLRVMGFRKQGWADGRPCHVKDPIIYERLDGGRLVVVQLWKDGCHRASHMRVHPSNPSRMHGCTSPTDFTTVEEMVAAVAHESNRTDHPSPPRWELPAHQLKGEG